MARLVARALRLGRSALIQTGGASAYRGHHRLSYLMPLLIWPESAVLVLPKWLQQQLAQGDIPYLVQNLPTFKPIHIGDHWPSSNFRGLLMTTPEAWLSSQLQGKPHFPANIPTLIDGADALEDWARAQFTHRIGEAEWNELVLAYPSQQAFIRDMRVRLTHTIFQHPINPYECYLLEDPAQTLLIELYTALTEMPLYAAALPPVWRHFWQQFQATDRLAWVQIDRQRGRFSLHCAPANIAPRMASLWAQQPVVIVGAAVDLDPQAGVFRQQLGLGEMTCLKFAPDRHQDIIQLYLPDRLPMPNTSQFQAVMMQEIRALLYQSDTRPQFTVIVVGDNPLKAQIGSVLAAEYGSRVQVDKLDLADNGILVTGWQFWQAYQLALPPPGLLIIPTLPIPSLENPLVSGRVTYYKRLHQDWFRLYLLPEALRQLQLAIAPVRAVQGKVALLDNRVNHRSYGQQVLLALSPAARSNYIDTNDVSSL
jgi:ATP-dependent DNA helicase DinG